MKVLGNDEMATGPAGTAENADDIIMIANYLYRTWGKCKFDHPIPFAANDGAWQVAA